MCCYEMNVAAPMLQSGLGFAQQGEFGLDLDHLNPERVAAHLSISSIDWESATRRQHDSELFNPLIEFQKDDDASPGYGFRLRKNSH